MKYTKKNRSKEVKHSGITKHSKSSDMQKGTKSNEDEANAVTRTPDEEIKACFEAAKQKLDGLLKSRKQVIQDLARELELLGRRREDIAAEIVHELRNCEELSRSQIYSYLDDKYKNQTQAQRRKGKKESNPDPKTGTESPLEQTITVGNDGQQTVYNEHDTQELREPADTPAESVTSSSQIRPTSKNQIGIRIRKLEPDPCRRNKEKPSRVQIPIAVHLSHYKRFLNLNLSYQRRNMKW